MNAIKIKTPSSLSNLTLCAIAARDPGPGEIRIRNHASSLNYHDLLVVNGGIPVADGRIPMSDGAGVVEAIGDGVTQFAVGDRVMSCFFPNWQDGAPDNAEKFLRVPGDQADGYATETVTAAATVFTRMPDHLNFEQAATLPCAALTAWRALMVEARIKPGDRVLVQGSGGVSVAALQFAKAAGCWVIATSSSDEKLQRFREIGADETINYREHPKWGKRALEITQGRGVDVIVETGGSGTVPESIKAIALGGHISMIGVLSGLKGEVPTALLFQKQATLRGIAVGSRAHQRDMVAAIEINKIEPVIDRSYPLAQISEAFERQTAQQHFGKICLNF